MKPTCEICGTDKNGRYRWYYNTEGKRNCYKCAGLASPRRNRKADFEEWLKIWNARKVA